MISYLLVICAIALFLYSKWESNYFKRRGIKNQPFVLPFIGNIWNALIQREHMVDVAQKIYKSFPDQKYVGFKQLATHMFLVRDIDIIKQVTIKDFDHFTNHMLVINNDSDPVFGNILFFMKGERWRDMRATLSPAFTSSKMRNMLPYIVETGEQMVEFFIQQTDTHDFKERGVVEIEFKDAFTRYANDVIATIAFGLNVDSLSKRDNEFYRRGLEATQFAGWRMVKFFIASSLTSVNKYVKLEVFSDALKNFFRDIVLGTMKNRERTGFIRHDMIHLLMKAKEGSLQHESNVEENSDVGFATVEESIIGQRAVRRQWADDEIVAQALIFFLAGFDPVSTLLCFTVHELTINSDVQKELQQEIDDYMKKGKGKLSYEDISNMKYMDMVIKWPPVGSVDRECVKDYQLPQVSKTSVKKSCTIYKGEGILIPIYSIHRDPQCFPDPEKFDPQRFSEDNKHNIKPFSFLPFGIGPRNCIGSRLALMETKVAIFYLLSKFDLVQTSKTQHPIKLSTKSVNMVVDKGFWVGLKPRNN